MGSWHNALIFPVSIIGVGIANHLDNPRAWGAMMAGIAVASLFAWRANYLRYRLIHDTPLSNIASAAQGFVELGGQLRSIGGQQQTSLLSHAPCLWFHCIVRVKRDNDWDIEQDETSHESFLLDDASGTCLLDPNGAEIISDHKKTWQEGERKYTEYLLLENDAVYALGDFITLADPSRHPEAKRLINEVIDARKQEHAASLATEQNKDGEWERVRQAAHSRMLDALHLNTAHSALHLLQRPRDGRPYLISNHPNTEHGRAFLIWSWVQIGIFLFACGGLAYFLAAAR